MDTLPRHALVTGGARRIGRAMVLALAQEGFDVTIHHRRSSEAAAALAREVESLGQRASLVSADLALEPETAGVVPAAVAAGGPLGVLVNSASVFELDRLATADRASWDRHMEINLRAPLVLTQGFAAQLPEAAEGAVVNLIDQRIFNLTPNFLSYSISRMGLWAMTRVLALELAPRIRVNAIGPGPTLPHPGMSGASFQKLVASLPLRRGPSSDDIAETLRFILRMQALTGQMLTIDGGQQLGWLPQPPRQAG